MNKEINDKINAVLKNYIGISSSNKIEFKSNFFSSLSNLEFKEDALYITLEVICKIRNFDVTDSDIDYIHRDLIEKVNEYNSKYLTAVKYKRLFYRRYSFEIECVINYVEDLFIKNNNFQEDILTSEELPLKKFKESNKWIYNFKKNLEDNFYPNIDYYYVKELEIADKQFIKDIVNRRVMEKKNQLFQSKLNYIKSFKEDFRKFISFINLNIYFDNEKRQNLIIKYSDIYNTIVNVDDFILDRLYSEIEYLKEFIETYSDLLEYSNFNDTDESNIIKKINQRYIDFEISENKKREQIEKEKAHEKKIKEDKLRQKKEFKNLIKEINEFNGKSILEMCSLRDYSIELHSKIIEFQKQILISSGSIKTFYKYFDNLEEICKVVSKNFKSTLINFFGIINLNIYFDYEKRQNLIRKYFDIYNTIVNVDDFILNKLYSEIEYLKEFVELYSDLLEYSNFNETKNNNLIKKINLRYISREISKNKEFFDDIHDPAKKVAIIMDENNIKVVAGAGTGKTFTIQSKVKYLIENKNVNPEKILCLCYTHKGASELDERVNKSLVDSKVEVCTFHEFARRVDRECGGIKSTNRYLLDDVIRNYIKDIIKNPKRTNDLMDYFSYYINPNIEQEFNTFKEFLENRKFVTLQQKYAVYGVENETLKGENVRSLGEMIIANYMFMHNIDYKYEARYERNHFSKYIKDRFLYSGKYFSLEEFSKKSKKDIVEHFIRYERRKAAYKPDFYLPEYELYLEHFGVNENDEVTWLKGKEKEQYERLMHSKRIWHKMYGTKLIETKSYYIHEGILIEKLEELLKQHGVKIGERKDKEKILKILLVNSKVGEYYRFSNLIKSFINIFEANNFPKSKLDEFKQQNSLESDLYTRKRQKLFLDIVSEIYERYNKLNQSNDIDHNREISNAFELIKNKVYTRKFDYILIDEYQDINYIRCKLIQEIQKNSNAKIFVVGDDWQSIYGFGGSDVKLFIEFEKYFPHSEKIYLNENRRNSQTINNIAKKFIEKNNEQDSKELTCIGGNKNSHPIKLVNYFDKKYSKALALAAILEDILSHNHKDNLKILLLGRMNEDIEGYINNRLFKEKPSEKFRKIIYSKDKNLDITFMSIHQSKGLEYDEVILLNLENDVKGFPSQIVDDPVLKFVKVNKESYPYAEERRLFYVALTRTKNNFYILYPDDSPSVFITEDLQKDFNIQKYRLNRNYSLSNNIFEDDDFFERIERYQTGLDCPECDDGKIIIVANNDKKGKGIRSVFVGCSNYPDCEYIAGPYHASIDDMKYVEKCPSCKGILVRQGNVLKCSMNYHGGCMETKELKLDEEDLKYQDYEK